jgi:hypothetical protein
MSSLSPKPSGRDRRVAVRYSVSPDGFSTENTCRPISSQPDQTWTAVVRDMSTGGVGLVVNRRFEPNTLLLVDVHDAEQTTTRTLLVRVVHVERDENNAWFLGCMFPTALSEAELLSLM